MSVVGRNLLQRGLHRLSSAVQHLSTTSGVAKKVEFEHPRALDARLTRVQKQALESRRMANDNPFDSYTMRPNPVEGWKKDVPILVPSTSDKRMVGCCCEDDYHEIVWFELEKGDVKKCDCGYYFKLIDYDPLDLNVPPRYGEGFGSGLSRYY